MEVKIEKRTLIKGRFAKLPLIACLLIIMVGCGALQRVSPRMYGSGQPTGKEVSLAMTEASSPSSTYGETGEGAWSGM